VSILGDTSGIAIDYHIPYGILGRTINNDDAHASNDMAPKEALTPSALTPDQIVIATIKIVSIICKIFTFMSEILRCYYADE